jgi:hypothetical protein
MMIDLRPAAALLALAIVASCGPGNPAIFAADPEAASDDSVAEQTEAPNPMDPGGIDDATGTEM